MDGTTLLAEAQARIDACRKADVTIAVHTADGRPAPGARVRVEQRTHAFLFGCNAFPVLTYTDPEQEARYQRAFTGLCNYATLGFYWGAYEAQPGETRREHLARQARWCREQGITVKGHPLVWHELYPAWGPAATEETRERLRERVTDIVSGFAGLIDIWDVVNEATVSARYDNGVGHWATRDGTVALVSEALGWARAAHPQATLLYNDYNLSLTYEELAAALTARNSVDALGIQSHMHTGEWTLKRVWEACETYARFGKPLHFTETTAISGEHGWERERPWRSTPEGEARQAAYVEQFYTLLFSHPAVHAITWWDLMDGGWMGAPAGLVRADLTPKPAYERLQALINGQWRTDTEVTTDAEGNATVRGFYGDYAVTVIDDAATFQENCSLHRDTAYWQITLPS